MAKMLGDPCSLLFSNRLPTVDTCCFISTREQILVLPIYFGTFSLSMDLPEYRKSEISPFPEHTGTILRRILKLCLNIVFLLKLWFCTAYVS